MHMHILKFWHRIKNPTPPIDAYLLEEEEEEKEEEEEPSAAAAVTTTTKDDKGAITSKTKPAIKHKTSPVRLAQLLQPSLASRFSLQLHPMTAYRPELDGIRRHWLQAKTKC